MKLRRSPREIADRSLQELRNLAMLYRPPILNLGDAPMPPLPALGTALVGDVSDLAAQIRAHRFPILGLTIETGPEIAWRRDYLHLKESGTDYFRLIPYLDFQRVGDHKVIWELNRHQHLVVLALDGDQRSLKEIIAQLESWFAANPFQRGINWASALEVAFRALSWVWIFHLVGDRFEADFRSRFLQQLYLHGCHLANNLSFYFSPNTHLLGEAVALHALGKLFPAFPRSGDWVELGGRVVREQMDAQVRGDGSHFEQSTYYHVYALDMFRFHSLLEQPSERFRLGLQRMTEFLHCLMGPARRLPFFGDDDGGRLFHPYGPWDQFGRRSLDEASDPLPPLRSQIFNESGLAVMISGDVHIIVDAGPFGPWGSGHSHSDTLSLTVRKGDEDILIDPGTYTYVADPKERDWFRGSAAHNTIRIGERDQAVPAGPFRWIDQPKVKIEEWRTDAEQDFLAAHCLYAGFTHRRTIRFVKPDRLEIEDEVEGPPGDHEIEQFWHLGSAFARSRICLDPLGELSEFSSWASSVLGEKHPSPAIRLARRGPLPQRFTTVINLGPIP